MGIKGFEFPLSGRARVLSSAISKEALASRRGSNNVSDSQEYGASMHKLEGPWYLFLPESRCRIFLDMLVVIAFFLTFILLPVQVVYCSTQADQKIVHSLIGSIFAANILSTFFTCYEDDTLRRLMPEEYKLLRADLLVTSLKKLSKSYIRSWFFLDIVAVVPCLLLDLGVFYPSLTCNSGFRYLALLKSLTIFQYLRSTDRIKEFNEGWFKRIRSFFIDNDLHALQRIAWLYFMFLVFNHYTGLIFLFIAQKEDKEDNWIGDDVAEDSASYVQSMYWALATSLTVGYGDVSPVTMNEKVYTMIVFMLGFLIHTAITGAVTVMFTEWDASHAKFMKEIAIITQFFKKYKHHLSRTLRSRVLRYYDYNWQHHGDRHLERMAEILPYHLMRDVKMAILHEMVSNCPLFKNCAEDFVCKLVMDLNPVSLLLGDSIFQEGDIGRELYFVHIGSMAVLVEELQVAVLKTGDYFGEVALLRTSAKRSATVKALTNSQLFVMPKDLLKDVLSYSPDIVSKLEKAAKNKLKSDSRRNMLKIKTIMAVRKSVPRMLSGGAGALSGLMQSDETRLEGLRTLRLCSVASNHSNSYLEEDKDQALEKCQAQDKDSSKAGRLLLHRFRQMSRSKSRSKNNSMSISREDASTTISNEDSLKNKEDEIQACSHTHNCSRRDSDRAPNQDGPSLHWNPASSTDNLLQNDTICGKESTCTIPGDRVRKSFRVGSVQCRCSFSGLVQVQTPPPLPVLEIQATDSQTCAVHNNQAAPPKLFTEPQPPLIKSTGGMSYQKLPSPSIKLKPLNLTQLKPPYLAKMNDRLSRNKTASSSEMQGEPMGLVTGEVERQASTQLLLLQQQNTMDNMDVQHNDQKLDLEGFQPSRSDSLEEEEEGILSDAELEELSTMELYSLITRVGNILSSRSRAHA